MKNELTKLMLKSMMMDIASREISIKVSCSLYCYSAILLYRGATKIEKSRIAFPVIQKIKMEIKHVEACISFVYMASVDNFC